MASCPMSEAIQSLRRTVLRDGAGRTDAQLLEDYLSRRDQAALAALVWRHGPMVWGVCRRVLRSHHDAEDAFQATFLVLVRRAASIASRELLANWLYGVAHQTALKARATTAKRSSRERQVTQMPEPRTRNQGSGVSGPEWDEVQRLLDQELSRLPDKYRSVIVLADLEGKSRKEAARQLGVPEGTVAGWLARARTMLAKRLARHGLAVSAGALATLLANNAASAGVPTAVVSNTLQAAGLYAAGQAAAGAISLKVAALTEGMLKAMLMNKLKIATAILMICAVFGAGVVGLTHPPQAAPQVGGKIDVARQAAAAETPKNDLDKLQGTWRLVTTEFDGVRFGEGRPEIKDTRMVFDKSSVALFGKTFHSPQLKKEPEDTKSVGTFTLDAKKNPKVIALTFETNPWNDKKDFTKRGIYALDGDRLTLCLSQDDEDMKIPSDFSAPNFGGKRIVFTFRREPPSAKETEKPQRPVSPNDVTAKSPIKPASPQKEDKEQLPGSWRMIGAESDGLRIGEGRPELKDNRLVIDKATFTLSLFSQTRSGGAEPEDIKSMGEFTLDAKQTPKVIALTWQECPWNDKKNFTQKAIYAVEGDTLRLCLSLADDNGAAPTEFSANAGSKRSLWTFRREPATSKDREKNP
jgi:RNA polymerase sigma factor (sigma-70 family)